MTQPRLLILDDEADFCSYVREVAEEEGYRVEAIQDPFQFQALFDGFDPNLIILDMVMPEKDGIEILRWLGEKDRPARVVLVTGYDPRYALMADKIVTGSSVNLNVTTLSKPVRIEDLRKVLRRPDD